MLSGARPIAAWVYFFGVMVAYAAVVLASPRPPAFVDYPDWVFQGVLLRGVLTGHPVAGYVLKPYPVPNSLTTVALGLMDCVLPWAWAAKVWICAYLMLASVAAWRLCDAAGARDWRLAVALPSVLFLNLDFWYGHISFEIGLCLLLLFAATMLRRSTGGAMGGLLMLLFFTHMEACACALLLLALAATRRRALRMLWSAAPVVVLTIWYALGRYLSGNADGRSVAPAAFRYGSPGFLLYKGNTFLKPFGYVNARAADGRSLTEAIFGQWMFLLLFSGALLVAGLCFWLVLDYGRERQAGEERLLVRFALSAFVLAALLPQVVLGVADPGSRLVLAGVALGLFAVRWRRPAGTALAMCSVVFCLVNLWQLARIAREPELAGGGGSLPAAVRTFAHVELGARTSVYDKLDCGEMNEAVFQTGMFRLAAKEDGRPR